MVDLRTLFIIIPLNVPLGGCAYIWTLSGFDIFHLPMLTLVAHHPPDAVIALGRLIAGIVLLHTLAEFLKDLVHFCFLASGAAMRPIHNRPIAARSLRDFWGKRWNLAVSAWLRQFFFLPLARQHRPDLGLLFAFLVSGALHAWVALVALGALAAFEIAMFFGLQGVFILAEDRLQVHAWPVPLARAWTFTVLPATPPLIICPYLRIAHL